LLTGELLTGEWCHQGGIPGSHHNARLTELPDYSVRRTGEEAGHTSATHRGRFAKGQHRGPFRASLFGRCSGDGNFTRLRLITHAGRPDFGFLGFRVAHLRQFFPVLVTWAVPLLASALLAPWLVAPPRMAATLMAVHLARTLTLLRGGLVHQVQNAKVVLGVLKVTLGHHAVATARRVASQLQVFLEQLLRGTAHPDVRAIAVEDVVPIKWDAAPGVVAHSAAATTATTSAATAA
jgi:hypothetical protein